MNRLADRTTPGAPERALDSLTDVAAAVARLLAAYLEHSGETLDRDLLEEFKSALYKGWAQNCGIRLASVRWRGGDDVRESWRDVHEELTRGV